MIENIMTLLMLIFLQAVLGFDNLLYISLESKRVPADKQKMVRMWGIGLAIVLRIVLLFVLIAAIKAFQKELYHLHIEGIVEATITGHAIIVLAGGLFIIYTAVKEISHMLTLHELGEDPNDNPTQSVGKAIAWIVIMNLVFSFDSILSAIALTEVLWVKIVAIAVSGIGMIALAGHVSEFLKKNRLYEVLGLFILLIVGIMLLSEGGHLAHLTFGTDYKVEAMTKTTFYFSIAVVVLVDLAQSRYQKKLDRERAATVTATPVTTTPTDPA